jgi:hypothetical protein
VTLKTRTVGSRDAIYRAGVEGAIAIALDPVESGADIGGAAPTRCVCALGLVEVVRCSRSRTHACCEDV